MAQSRAFYEALGWQASRLSQHDVAFFQLGGMVLALYGRAALAADTGLAPAPAGRIGFSLAQNVADEAAVDAVLARAAAAGGTVLRPGGPVFWGGYVGYFADPDGHVWEIAWNPQFRINPDGTISLPA